MGLWQWFHNWFGRPPESNAARVPQAGGSFGKHDTVFDGKGVVLLRNEVCGMGGTLLWQVGAEVGYSEKDGPQRIKLQFYRDAHLLIESLEHEVNTTCPALTIHLATEDRIGIGRYNYSLQAVVVRGQWARVRHSWMTWIERRP